MRKCEVLDKQNFEPKYRMVYDNTINRKKIISFPEKLFFTIPRNRKNYYHSFFVFFDVPNLATFIFNFSLM